MLKAIHAQEDKAAARQKAALVAEKLGCVVNRFVLYYANVKKGCRENGECIRTT